MGLKECMRAGYLVRVQDTSSVRSRRKGVVLRVNFSLEGRRSRSFTQLVSSG
jgi:hypothetical protein